jgi:hypothetical protein
MNKAMLKTRKQMFIQKMNDEDYLVSSYERQRRKRWN